MTVAAVFVRESTFLWVIRTEGLCFNAIIALDGNYNASHEFMTLILFKMAISLRDLTVGCEL